MQVPALGGKLAVNQWQHIFADAVEPVGVCDPFYIQLLEQVGIGAGRGLLFEQLIEYNAVVYTLNLDLFSVVLVIKPGSFLYQITDANG